MDFTLSPDQEAVRAAARDFVEREVVPHARDWDRAEEMDRDIVGSLAEKGFLGAVIPERYGGIGLDNISYCCLVEEIGRGDASVRGIVSVSNGLVGKTLLMWGTDEQREQWLPGLCSGERIGCFALTEPGHGSDAAALSARAERVGSDWVISGSKVFITQGTWASFALIFARTGEQGPRGITCFIVPTDAPGFQAHALKGKLGQRSQDTAELQLDGVRVPDTQRLGDDGAGFMVAMKALAAGRMSVAAGSVGLAQACLDASVAYAKDREAFGRPIARFQLIQALVADVAVEIEAARLLTWKVATMADAGKEHALESSMAKYFASETAVRAANAAVQIHGGYGYIDEFPVGRFLRDARVTTLYEGTSQIQQLIIGRALTGENAFW